MRKHIVLAGERAYYLAESTPDSWLWRLLPMNIEDMDLARSVAALFDERSPWKGYPPRMIAEDIGLGVPQPTAE